MPGAILVDPEVLQQARQLYEETSVPIDAIAGMMGMKSRTFQTLREKHGWKLRQPRRPAETGGAAAAEPEEAGPPVESPVVAALPGADRAATISRIRDTVEREIAAVELSLRRLDRLTPRVGDGEKAARTLASLVKTLNELKRLDAAQATDAPAAEDGTDIDEFRRDLARRLDALCASGEDG
jgi:hypothetical protein